MHNNRYLQVKDRAHRRIRGLWKRNDTYYVQTTVQDTETGLKKVTRISLPLATDIDSAKAEAAILKKKIAEGETVHGKQGPTFSAYREHYIKTAMKKPKTLYNENYFLKRWEKFLKADTKIGHITKQNVLAFRVKLKDEKYSARTINLHMVSLAVNFAKLWEKAGGGNYDVRPYVVELDRYGFQRAVNYITKLDGSRVSYSSFFTAGENCHLKFSDGLDRHLAVVCSADTTQNQKDNHD
jgi:hypothetical protein